MKRIAIPLLGAALVAGVALLLWKEKQPLAVSSKPLASEPEREVQPVPKAIQPTPAPAPAPEAIKPVALPPGTTIARPGGDPNAPIPAAPPGERTVRDHRGRTDEVPPPIKVTPQGMTAATAAIRPAIASCLSGPTTLQFTLAMSGGRAQAQQPKLTDADRKPDVQACVEKALANLSWATPDKDGTTPVMMPLTSSSGSKN